MTYEWIFTILKIEMLKTSTSFVKTIRQSFVNKGTSTRKVGSDRHRDSTLKHDHRLKMTVLKGIRKRLLSTAKFKLATINYFLDWQNREEWWKWDFYQKYVKKCFLWSTSVFFKNSHFKPVAFLLWKLWGTRTNFLV